ncbi:glycosyltransferase [Pseudopedobacter sp.]|uniref:glycosyltransferase n=1 Tax=Pseudopedobacter sp. TaxID=1936787 RepID=UPI00333F206A
MEAYLEYTLLAFLLIFFLIQLYYLIVVQRKLNIYNSDQENISYDFKVSVVICARNESKNLQENLPLIFQQKGIDFEVVVVNDCSFDNSDEILRDFKEQYANLKVVTKEEHVLYKTGKKFALTLGIKAASNEILVFTDADCKPCSDEWLVMMCSAYRKPQAEIVLGYSPYEKKKGLLNMLIRYETFQTALNYFSFALNGMPYMGVGRNLSYKKALFFKNKGFASHMHIPSGDDDLFVNQTANVINTFIEIRPESHVISEPKDTWKGYWNQKLRHFGAGKAYKKTHQFQLTLQGVSAIGFYVFIVTCLALQIYWPYILGVFFIRFLVQILIYSKSLTILRCKDLIWSLLFLDLFYQMFLMIISFRRIFRKKIAWK